MSKQELLATGGPQPSGDSSRLPDAAVHLDWSSSASDGGRFRKAGLVRYLASVAPGGFEELVLPRRASRTRLGRAVSSAMRLLEFCETTRASTVLFFYPDFPLFQPPSVWKLGHLGLLLAAIRRRLARRGIRIVLDVEDLPGPQHQELFGVRHPAFRAVASAERLLDGFADELWLPTRSLLERWPAGRGRAPTRYRLVPTGAAARMFRPERSQARLVRFLYAGTLDRRQDRGIETMLEIFRAVGGARTRLCLAGPGAEWIRARGGGDPIEVAGVLGEGVCEDYAVGCDYGLVPYPERGYLHEVFPAKLALYAACGLSILSTRLKETALAVEQHSAGLTLGLDEWPEFVRTAPPAAGGGAPWLWSQILR